MPNTSTSSPNITYIVHIASWLELFQVHINQSCEAYIYTHNSANLAQPKEPSLSQRNPSLKLPTLVWARLQQEARRGLAQASPTHSDETILAQASGLRIGEPSKQMGVSCCCSRLGESSSLKRKLSFWAINPLT